MYTFIQVRRESISQGFLLDLFFFYFPMKVTGATFIIARGKPWPPALNDSPKAVLLLGEIGWGSLLGHKVRLPEQKDTLHVFKMLKLIVKFLSCLRLKTLKTIPSSVAHNCFGQIQCRSQLSEQCRECTCGYRCIYYISSHLCGKNVLAVVHIGVCMSLTDCVLYHNNNNIIHWWTFNLEREQKK